ncbi:MAG TPA: malate synthase A [Candidatus Thermoplasmatota archaeon]|nr:malate synthase A [Candidatus Thermoplasmatota archaeon]
MKTAPLQPGVLVVRPATERQQAILTNEAVTFLAELHERFDARRRQLLARRAERQAAWDRGGRLDFLPETRGVREMAWSVTPPPQDLVDRRVEITGPTDAKMVINALNSGASVFMADFEDANTPHWANLLEGQANLRDAVRRELTHESGGKTYRLGEKLATLVVRPRGWHMEERHVKVQGEPMSASLFDFGLYVFHNGARLLADGSGPYLYLPKMESHLEARLWNEVFAYSEHRLGLPLNSIRATVLIETLPAAFEMEEILWELRDRSPALNAGRWDYLFSCIKTLRNRTDLILPDRAAVTMEVPFLRAYARLLVKACHKRGAYAIGGMAAFVPSRKDPAVNESALARVRADKQREVLDGFDGTWVAHPDLVPVARSVFDAALAGKPNQLERQRDDVRVRAHDLLDLHLAGGPTRAGLRLNVEVAIQYIAHWLAGQGAVAIHNLMEDAATAEISRAQVWQWCRHGARLEDGTPVTDGLVRELAAAAAQDLASRVPEAAAGKLPQAAEVFLDVALSDPLPDFLTLSAYRHVP